jgi:hypothetical protein
MKRSWDLRSLTSIPVADAVKRECLPAVVAAYAGSLDWPIERQRAVAEKLAVLTVQRLISELPGLPPSTRIECRSVEGLLRARTAAALAQEKAVESVAVEAATSALEASSTAIPSVAAQAAADAAARVAKAVEDEAVAAMVAALKAREAIFRSACAVWLHAAESTLPNVLPEGATA